MAGPSGASESHNKDIGWQNLGLGDNLFTRHYVTPGAPLACTRATVIQPLIQQFSVEYTPNSVFPESFP